MDLSQNLFRAKSFVRIVKSSPPPITVKIVVRLEQISLTLSQSITPDTPFNIFIDDIAKIISKTIQQDYWNALIFHLQNGIVIIPKETRNLIDIGFENDSILYVDDRKSYLKFQSSEDSEVSEVEVDVEFFIKSDDPIRMKELVQNIKKNIQTKGHKVQNCKVQVDFIHQ